MQRVEGRLPVAAQVRRRARAIHDERVGNVVFRRIETVRGGVEPDVRQVAPLELGEEQLEPVGVLVVDGDGFHGRSGVKVRSQSEATPSNSRGSTGVPTPTKTPRSVS